MDCESGASRKPYLVRVRVGAAGGRLVAPPHARQIGDLNLEGSPRLGQRAEVNKMPATPTAEAQSLAANLCPHCQATNPAAAQTCSNCGKKMFVQPQNEWRSRIQTLERDYKKARGLVHGLQKDAIQNGWGAKKKGQPWSFAFELVKDANSRTLLTMTDSGTWGLTGDVYDDPEAIPDSLPEQQRLARFENMNFSGGQEGPGLYGQGKLLFQAVSRNGEIIYDSLTSEQKNISLSSRGAL